MTVVVMAMMMMMMMMMVLMLMLMLIVLMNIILNLMAADQGDGRPTEAPLPATDFPREELGLRIGFGFPSVRTPGSRSSSARERSGVPSATKRKRGPLRSSHIVSHQSCQAHRPERMSCWVLYTGYTQMLRVESVL